MTAHMDATLSEEKVEAIRKSALHRLAGHLTFDSGIEGDYEDHVSMDWIRSHIEHLSAAQAEIFFDVVNAMVERAIRSGRKFTSEGFLCRNIHFAQTATSAAGIVACYVVGAHMIPTWEHGMVFDGWVLHADIGKVGVADVFRVE